MRLLKMITIFPYIYTLLYNSTIGRWIINDFPLVLLYLDSLAEYHDRLAVVTFPIVSDKSCHHSLRRYRELSELRGVEALDIAYHNLVSFPVNEVGGIVVTVKQRPSLILDLSLELLRFQHPYRIDCRYGYLSVDAAYAWIIEDGLQVQVLFSGIVFVPVWSVILLRPYSSHAAPASFAGFL